MPTETYKQRADLTSNLVMKKLFRIIDTKQTNLCIAANLPTMQQVIKLVDCVGKLICMLKVQTLGLQGVDEESLKILYKKKHEYMFLLFDDMKHCDGREAVSNFYRQRIKYFDLITVLPLLDQTLEGVRDVINSTHLDDGEPRGCLPVCEFSFKGSRYPSGAKMLEISEQYSDICVGIIAQDLPVKNDLSMFKVTPGINLDESNPGDGQQWRRPGPAIFNGADVVIVGRGITSADPKDWESVTEKYRRESFRSYQLRSGERPLEPP